VGLVDWVSVGVSYRVVADSSVRSKGEVDSTVLGDP